MNNRTNAPRIGGGGGVCRLTYYFNRLNREKQQYFCKKLQYFEKLQETESDFYTPSGIDCQSQNESMNNLYFFKNRFDVLTHLNFLWLSCFDISTNNDCDVEVNV